MANYFEIAPPEGLSVVKIDSSGRGQVQFTVKNVSAVKRDTRAMLVSMPSTPGAVEKNWVKIDGAAQKPIEPGKSETFLVKIAVPPKSPEGSYGFRLGAVLVERTDEGDYSQTLTFNIGPAPAAKPFKWWIPVAAVVALIIIGVVVWLVMPKGVAVPDLKGQTPSEARNSLESVGLTLDSKSDSSVELIESTPELAGKIAEQLPEAGSKVKKGAEIQVKLGSVSVTVPNVQGQLLDQATKTLQDAGLVVQQAKSLHVLDAVGGTVLSQSIPAGTKAKSLSPIELTVAQEQVVVPSIKDVPVAQAVLALQNAKLVYAGVSGNQPNSNVTGTNPAAGTPVDVGTKVTLIVPSTCFNCAVFNPAWQSQQLIVSRPGAVQAIQPGMGRGLPGETEAAPTSTVKVVTK